MIEARKSGGSWSSEKILLHYESTRRNDNLLMKNFIELLYILFRRRSLPFELIRNACFLAVQKSSVMNRLILKHALGM
jgi:2-polyprenyl-6-methoxyphenol hydroxylase-like FAD-dependent oxidoreductase